MQDESRDERRCLAAIEASALAGVSEAKRARIADTLDAIAASAERGPTRND